MNLFSAQQVLFLHARLIEETGGSHGLRDVALLESAVARPQATFDRADLYPDLFTKAAVLMHSLIANLPFVDGNKRTGIAAAGLVLMRNGWRLEASNAQLEAFTLRVARGESDSAEIARWLRSNSSRQGDA